MGAITFSLDDKLLEHLRAVLPLDVLVETGTFRGDTLANAAEHFSELHSVELSQELFDHVSHRFAEREHIHLSQGESPPFLRNLRPQLAGRRVLFWLDAHWCVEDAAEGETSQCPLLDELAALGQIDDHSVVLIDDARLYVCPAPTPHETSQWPSLQDVLSSLRMLNDRHEVMIVNDVIVFFPPQARDALERYARENGVDWLAVISDKRECDDLQQQLMQVREHVAEVKQTAATYETAIDDQQQRLDHYRQVVAEDKETIDKLGHTIDQLRETIDQLNQANRKKAETIDALRVKLDAAHASCDAQRELTRQRDETIARKHADFERVRTDLGRRLATLREQLQGRHGAKRRHGGEKRNGCDHTGTHTEAVNTPMG